MEPRVAIVEADLSRTDHQEDVLALTAKYALDVMGNGAPLSPEACQRLIPGLRSHPTTLILLAYVKEKAVGLATCFRGFSTFSALPVIQIEDFFVVPDYRGLGIGQQLLAAVLRVARQLGCCKVTLEVQEHNMRARRLYERSGFAQAVYGETTGGSLHYWKRL